MMMTSKLNLYSTLLLILVLSICGDILCSEEMEVIFSDDFSGYEDGTVPTEKWSAFSGHWFVKDGVLHQDAGGFDHGIVARDLYLRCDYRIESKVRLVSGGAGAGLYWNVYDALTGENGHMLRFDGNHPIMYGWMHGRGFLGTGGATGELYPDEKWHTIRMDVNNDAGTFDVFWDGKRITDGALLYHRSGYAGLECSLGTCQFDDFRISVLKGTDWRASPSGEVRPEWIQSLAILPDGNITYPIRNMHRIQIITPDGELVREFGEFGDEAGQLNLPTGIACDGGGRIYVTESGNNRVQVFDLAGKSLEILKIEGENTLRQPFGIAVDSDGRVWVADQGNNRVVCFGTVTLSLGELGDKPGQFNKPMHLSFVMGKLYVADTNNRRIQVFDSTNLLAEPAIVPMPQMIKSVQYDGKGTFVVAGHSSVMTFDREWNQLKEFHGGACDRVWPDYSTYDGEGNLLVADGWKSRILILSAKLSPVKPAVSEVTTNSAVVTWETDLPVPTKLALLDEPVGSSLPRITDYSSAMTFGDGETRAKHRIEISGLEPSTRYTYAIVSPAKTIPASGYSIDYRFATKPPEGMMTYTEVPLAILCYTNVTFEGHKNPDGTPRKPDHRDDPWFQHAVDAHETMRYFYWINSRFRLDTKCIYLKVTRPVDWAYLGSSSEEVYKDVQTLAAREGLKPTDFGAVLVIGGSAAYAYPWPTPWWGGKLTYTTGCCFPGGGDTWLSTHEFHHLTEGWMSMTATPGYTSADAPWTHPGNVGENYDFLSHTLRIMPPETYLNLAVGKLVLAADRDDDGVPDDEPNVIFDEKRGGTSPKNKYSYRNGLTDLQNLTAEIFNPAPRKHKHKMLKKEVNLKYPFAVFDYEYERKKKSPTVDGTIKRREWDKFASTPNAVTPPNPDLPSGKAHRPVEGASYEMDTYLNWDDDYIYFAAAAPYKFLISVQLDCNADGYFSGKDNPRMTFQIPRDESKSESGKILPPPGVMVWNNVGPVQKTGIPNWTNDLFDKKENIKWAWGKSNRGWYVIEAAIPKCENVGLDLNDGKEMSVRLWIQGFLPPTDENKDPRYAFEMFDSCEYGYFKLVK